MSINAKVTRINRPIPGVVQVSDVLLNDSDKTFLVPNGSTYRVLAGNVNLVTTATATNRQIELHVLDESSNIVHKVSAGLDQAPSQDVDYVLSAGANRETSVVNGELIVNIPVDMALRGGWSLRIFDSNAVDAAADDMTVRLVVEEIEE